MEENIAQRYADSIYEVAQESSSEKLYLQQLKAINQIFSKTAGSYGLWLTPGITAEKKQKLLSEVFGGRVEPCVENFLKLLVEKRRIQLLAQIVGQYEKRYNQENGLCSVKVTTARPLGKELEKRLIEKLKKITGRQIILNKQVDPALLGGLVLEMENREIDASVRTRLQNLQRQLSNYSTLS